MTDNELKFFDPETGRPLHRVPDGATIPKNTPYGYTTQSGAFNWRTMGCTMDIEIVRGSAPHFTREPIAPPLPTKPGAYLDKDGIAVEKTDLGDWYVIGSSKRIWGVESRAPFAPASIVPTETWDRLRVLDPEGKRDRVDRNGDVWHLMPYDKWETSNDLACSGISTLHRYYGPLRFADEVSDR